MKKQLWHIIPLLLFMALVLCACGSSTEDKSNETSLPNENVINNTETEPVFETEPEIALESEWLNEQAIDEALSYLFPVEGEINVDKAQEILLPLVEAGNAEAQYYWGYICDNLIADNTGEEEKESLYWYELSLQQGFSKAYLAASQNTFIDSDEKKTDYINQAKQTGIFEATTEELGPDGCFLIGNYYLDANNQQSAMDWYMKSAYMGNTSGMSNLGALYYYMAKDGEKANKSLEWLMKAAKAGDVYGMHNFAAVLTDEDIALSVINQKHAEALPRYEKAAEEGDPEAMYFLAQRYSEYQGVVKHDYDTAREWIQKAAEAGHVEAMYKFAWDYGAEDKEYWYRKAAEAGHTKAMYELGQLSSDPVEAVEWYHKAAESGNSDAMLALYYVYLEGDGVAMDIDVAYAWLDKFYTVLENQPIDGDSEWGKLLSEALEWYGKAASNGHAIAMHHIGYWSVNFPELHVYGMILRYDEQLKWYKKAAEAGDNTAMFDLGYLYEKGNENGYWEQDYDEAMKWYIKAYASGYEPAVERINKLLANHQGVNAYFENYGELISPNS